MKELGLEETARIKYNLRLGILLFIFISLPVHFLISNSVISSISINKGTYRITDFCYWIIVVKSFWSGETNSIYTLDSNLLAMSSFFGQEIKYAMPIGVSPTALLIWLPFSYVATHSLPLANTAWVSFSLTVFFMSIIMARRTIHSWNPYFSNIFLFITSLLFLSFAFQGCLFKGNTGILATGIFILLVLTLYSQTKTNLLLKFLLTSAYLFILSIKTTYLAIAIILLLIFGRILEIALFSGFIILLSILLNVYLGTGLILEWFEVLSVFFLESIPEYYASSFEMPTFITFQSAFSMFFGHLPTMIISQLFLFAGCVGILLMSASIHIASFRNIGQNISPAAVNKPTLSVFLFSVVLLFLPYINASDDLLIFICFFIVLLFFPQERIRMFFLYFALFLTFLLLNHNAIHVPKPIWLLWGIKTSIFTSILMAVKNPYIHFSREGVLSIPPKA